MSNGIGYIYKTTNLINGKIYIGQHQNVKFEFSYYGSGKILKRAIKKYGTKNFKVELLYWANDVDDLCINEIWFISHFNSTSINVGYNISTGGKSGSKGTKLSIESIERIREKLKGKTPWNLGIPSSEEVKEKMRGRIGWNKGLKMGAAFSAKLSLALKGREVWNKGILRTDEEKRKMSETKKANGKQKGKNNPSARAVICVETGEIFDTMKEAGVKYNCSSSLICSVCRNNKKAAKGFHWQYYEAVA